MNSRLVLATNCKPLAINYHLALGNPFPAALENTIMVYDWLLSNGIDPSQICINGDFAGGGLAISTLLAMHEQWIPLPAGVFCFSPGFGLTLSGNFVTENMNLDLILSAAILQKYVHYYIGNHNANNP